MMSPLSAGLSATNITLTVYLMEKPLSCVQICPKASPQEYYFFWKYEFVHSTHLPMVSCPILCWGRGPWHEVGTLSTLSCCGCSQFLWPLLSPSENAQPSKAWELDCVCEVQAQLLNRAGVSIVVFQMFLILFFSTFKVLIFKNMHLG